MEKDWKQKQARIVQLCAASKIKINCIVPINQDKEGKRRLVNCFLAFCTEELGDCADSST
jgi:hypothetical protein